MSSGAVHFAPAYCHGAKVLQRLRLCDLQMAERSAAQDRAKGLDIPPNTVAMTEGYTVLKQNALLENFQPLRVKLREEKS